MKKKDYTPEFTRFTPEGDQAIAIVEQLARDIAAAWQTLIRNVRNGLTIDAAIVLFMQMIRDLMQVAFAEVWRIGRGGAFEGDQELVNVEPVFEETITEMETVLQSVDREAQLLDGIGEKAELLVKRVFKSVFFAGAVWKLFNLAKVHGAAANELWVWVGPVDANTCDVCREEVAAGARPLGEIRRYPGRDTICLDNCRHELVKVT